MCQTYQDIEVVVVDDGSTDDSFAIIKSFGSRLQAIQQENHGACRARNRGAEIASGKALMFLDADDMLASNTIEALVSVLVESKPCIATCPWDFLAWCEEDWEEKPSEMKPSPPGGDYIRGWLSGWFIPPCGLLWSRSAFELVGGWDEALHANQDGDIMLRALIKDVEIYQTTEGKALYRTYENTSHTSTSKKQTPETILSRARVMEKVAQRLENRGQLATYALEIGRELHKIAKRGFGNAGSSADPVYLDQLEDIANRARSLAGSDAITGNFLHRLGCRVLGLRRKEHVASSLARIGIGSSVRKQRL